MRIIIALAFFSQWSGNGLVSFYLTKVFDSIGITNKTIQVGRFVISYPTAAHISMQLLINGILQIWNLSWALLAAAYCDKIGRRKLFLASGIGMVIFFTLQTACSAVFQVKGSSSAAHAVIAFIFLFYAAYEYVFICLILVSRTKSTSASIAFTPLIISYTVEILPYHIRAKGFTIFIFSISLSVIFNQYVNPIALGTLFLCMCPYCLCTMEYRCNSMEVLRRSPVFSFEPLTLTLRRLSIAAGLCVRLCSSGSVSLRFFFLPCEISNTQNRYHRDQEPHARGNCCSLRWRQCHRKHCHHCCYTCRRNT
jgi:MFS family permease